MTTFSIDPSALASVIHGMIITPADPTYDAARRVFVGGVDKKPALIVRVADDEDVRSVVRLARETGLELAVRSGGHSSAGYSTTDGGIVLDLSSMKRIDIDTASKTCWAEAGLTAAEYTKETGAKNLVTGFGDTGTVGIGGITLGGGIGYLVRKYGCTIDDVLAADIVTADGNMLRTDATHEPDLFWAIRGGGGNFGVVTRFKYRLHAMALVVGGMMILPATPESIAAAVRISDEAPRELSTIINIMTCPPMPFVPKETYGKPVIMLLVCFAGDESSAAPWIGKLRSIAKPLADFVKSMPYPSIYPPEQSDYHPRSAGRTMFLDRVDESVADTILSYVTRSNASMAVCQIRVLGGAMADVVPTNTAFFHRKSEILANLAALYADPKDKMTHETWVGEFMQAIRQSDEGAYVNFLGDEGEARVHAAYPDAVWDRLVAVKSWFDPHNVFRLNQNIPPEN